MSVLALMSATLLAHCAAAEWCYCWTGAHEGKQTHGSCTHNQRAMHHAGACSQVRILACDTSVSNAFHVRRCNSDFATEICSADYLLMMLQRRAQR